MVKEIVMRKATVTLLLIGLAASVGQGRGVVTKAVQKLFPGATVTRLDVEDEGLFIRGRKSDGLGFELTMSASGEAREVCEQIDVKKVPGAIVQAVGRRVKGGRILTAWKSAETSEESEEEVLYRLVVQAGGEYLTAVAEIDEDDQAVHGHVTAVLPLTRLPKAVAAAAKKHLRPIEIGRGGDDGTRSVCKTIALAEEEADEAEATMYWWHLEDPRRHYVITGDGKTVLVRQPIEPEDLPKAVGDAVKKAYPRAKVNEAVKLTENGRTAYRIEAETADDDLVLLATPDGKITVEAEEEEEGEEEEESEEEE